MVLCHRMAWSKPIWNLEQTHHSSGSHLWTSYLGTFPHKTVPMSCQSVPDFASSSWTQKAQGLAPILKTLLYELQCNCALWNALGNTLVHEGPWKAPVVLLLSQRRDSYHTEAINPTLVSCEKKTHTLAELFFYWVGTSSLVNELMRHQNYRAVSGDVQRLFAQWYCAITIHFDSVFPSSPCSWFIWIVAKMAGCLGN